MHNYPDVKADEGQDEQKVMRMKVRLDNISLVTGGHFGRLISALAIRKKIKSAQIWIHNLLNLSFTNLKNLWVLI